MAVCNDLSWGDDDTTAEADNAAGRVQGLGGHDAHGRLLEDLLGRKSADVQSGREQLREQTRRL